MAEWLTGSKQEKAGGRGPLEVVGLGLEKLGPIYHSIHTHTRGYENPPYLYPTGK